MKVKNIFIIFSLLIVFMCCVSAISAVSDDSINFQISEIDSADESVSIVNDNQSLSGDDYSQDKISENSPLLGVANDNDKSNNSGTDIVGVTDENVLKGVHQYDEISFSGLNTLIGTCQNGDVIYLNSDLTDNDRDSWEINIDKSITIDGQGHTINAQQMSSIFYVFDDAEGVTLKNIIFTNGQSPYANVGGAITWCGQNGKIINCTFNNNHAVYGGAISFIGSNGIIENSTFTSNSANFGGAVVFGYRDFNNQYQNEGINGRVINSKFDNNQVSYYGGAIAWYGYDGNVENSEFTNNYADDDGGAIDWEAYNGKISGSIFVNNNAPNHGTISDCFVDVMCNYNAFINSTTWNKANINAKSLNYNWFGANNPNLNKIADYTDSNPKWVMANLIYLDNGYTVCFNQINDTEENLQDFANGNKLPSLNVTYIFKDGSKTIAPVGETVVTDKKLYYAQIDNQKFYDSRIDSKLNASVPESVYTNEIIPIGISLNNSATGYVSIYIDNNEKMRLFLKFNNNNFTVYSNNLNAGKHNITVKYSGDNNFDASTLTKEINVNIPKMDSYFTVVSVNGSQISAKLSDANGNAIPNANITYTIAGTSNTASTNASGLFVIKAEFDKQVEIIYAGSDVYKETTTSMTIYAAPKTAVVDENVYDIVYVDGTATIDTDMDDKIDNLTSQLDEAKANATKLNNSLIEVNKQIEDLNQIVGGNATKLVNDLAEARSNITNLTNQLNVALDNATNLSNNLTAANKRVDDLTSDLREAQANATNLSNNLTAANKRVDDLTSDLREAQANATKLDNDLNDANKKVDDLTSDLREAQANATELANNLAVANQKVDDLTSQLNAFANATVDSPKLATQFNVTNGFKLQVYAVDYKAGERGAMFDVLLTDSNGNRLVNQTVLFAINGWVHNRTTDANGVAHLQINLQDANKYTCAPCYLGNTTYNATFASATIEVIKKPITITAAAKSYKATAKTKKYSVTLKTIKGSSSDGKTYLSAGKKVTMKINGKTYSAKINAKGQATFSLKITKKGKYTATVSFAGDKTYNSASKSVKITIK